VTIETSIGELQKNMTAMLIDINGTVGILKTELMEPIEVELEKINATIADVHDGVLTITSTLGDIQEDLEAIKDDISLELISVVGDIEEGLANVTAAIIDAEGNILLELGQVTVKLEDINATLTDINADVVTIRTDIGTIKGKITSIEGDVATIETDIGTIKTILEEWTGVTTSSITTPVGTFVIFVLTNSTLEGPATFSDSTLTLIVSGQTGTTGTLNVKIPRQLLVGLGSSIDEFAVTLNGRRVSFTYTEEEALYTVRLRYTHSTHTIKIHLSHPDSLPQSLWALLVIVLTMTIPAIAIMPFALKTRKRSSAKAQPPSS